MLVHLRQRAEREVRLQPAQHVRLGGLRVPAPRLFEVRRGADVLSARASLRRVAEPGQALDDLGELQRVDRSRVHHQSAALDVQQRGGVGDSPGGLGRQQLRADLMVVQNSAQHRGRRDHRLVDLAAHLGVERKDRVDVPGSQRRVELTLKACRLRVVALRTLGRERMHAVAAGDDGGRAARVGDAVGDRAAEFAVFLRRAETDADDGRGRLGQRPAQQRQRDDHRVVVRLPLLDRHQRAPRGRAVDGGAQQRVVRLLDAALVAAERLKRPRQRGAQQVEPIERDDPVRRDHQQVVGRVGQQALADLCVGVERGLRGALAPLADLGHENRWMRNDGGQRDRHGPQILARSCSSSIDS